MRTDPYLEWVHPRLAELERCQRALRDGSIPASELVRRFGADALPPLKGGSAPGPGFTVTWTAKALTAATAATMVGLLTGSNTPLNLVEFSVSGDATSGNLLIEEVLGTNASNAPGTNSTSFTPLQVRGQTQTFVATAGINWTAEPTVLTVVKRWRYPFPGGPFTLQLPLGRELNSIPTASTSGKFVGFRLTASVAVTNCDGYLEVEEG